MIPSISSLAGVGHGLAARPAVHMPALDDFYSLAAAAVCLAVLGILALVLLTTSSPSPHGYTRLDTDAESPSLPTLDDDNGENEVQGYAFELRKAHGTPLDTQAFERHRLLVHIAIAVLAVVGLALDAAAIVQLVLASDEIPSSLYLASASAGLHTVQVVLSMLDLRLAEATRLAYISLLAFVWLLVKLLVALSEYRLRLPIHAADAGQLLFTLNVLCGTIGLVVAFISPSGPKVMVDATQNLTARQILRNTVGGGSVAQNAWGFKAFPVVKQAHTKGRIEEDDVPALDYTYKSAYVAEEMIRKYRQLLAASTAKNPAAGRSDAVKARVLLSSLIACNAAELKATAVVLVITTFSFYFPKLGMSILLNGIEQYDQTLKGPNAIKDTVPNRARATLIYSAVFYLTLLWEGFIVYYYFRPLGTYLKTKVQTQLTTLLAWKRLRQKEASAPSGADDAEDAKEAGNDEGEASASSSSQVINLVTTDANRIFSHIDMFSFGIMGPLEVFVGGWSAYYLLGNGALMGLLVAALMQPIAILIGRITERIDDKLQKSRDKRVMLLSEAIRAIRMIKYEAWEDDMAARIMHTRRAELKCQAQSWIVFTFFGGFFAFVPMLTIVVAFAWYTVVEGQQLTASVAFPAVAVLMELRFAVSYLPSNFLMIIQGWVSLKRIAAYLETGEVELKTGEYTPATRNGADNPAGASSSVGRIALKNAEITWPSEGDASAASGAATPGRFSLSIPEATFEVGKTNLVCGKIGSGKTLLLLSLLGEAQLTSGSIECPRSHPAASLYAVRSASSHRRAKWWIDLSLAAYAPQRPFLFNATVRDNIIFGLEYDAHRYRAVIFACGLKPDLKIFKDGDRTEIGEGGTNLSGGQKARISLARAVYSHAGTVLIDDCLSALDSHTTKHICEKLFDGGESGLLAGRTTVLVTHHVKLMASRCSKVLVLQEGRQAFFGSADQFTNSIFFQLESEQSAAEKDDEEHVPSFGSNTSTAANSAANSDEEDEALLNPANVGDGKGANASEFSVHTVGAEAGRTTLRRRASVSAFSHVSGLLDGAAEGEEGQGDVHKQVTEETRKQGRVSFAVYSGYVRAGGGLLVWLLLLGSFAANAFSDLGANWWLRLWAQSTADGDAGIERAEHSTEWWLSRWMLIQSVQVVVLTAGYALVCTASLLAGSRLFKQLLRTVLRAPLRFHDSTPSGRLLNRFGRDMEQIDSSIAEELTDAAKSLLMALAALVATWIGGGPILIVMLFFMAPVFYVLVSTFTIAARDLKRLDSNSASKRITCFTDLITGVVTIRAFGSSAAYYATLMERLDENMMFYFWQGYVRQWQSLLFSLATSGFVISTVLVVTLVPGSSAARAGFTLSFVQNLTSMLQFGLRSMSNVEQGLVAVERVMEYFDIDTEPLDAPPQSAGGEIKVAPNWPDKGAIEIQDLHLAYADNLPDVLDGITLSIGAGERVGIVGATGSGKSTLVSALFRFFEYRSGSIVIDGVDIGRLGLKTLRSRMKIVPQDPLILSGTLRSAVDPLEQYSDVDISRILVRVGLLKEKLPAAAGYGTFNGAGSVPNLAGGSTSSSTLLAAQEESSDDSGMLTSLEARIEESGTNLSAGQKQLLSLSRILLSASNPENANSIVVLDESTSSIDYATDAKIQTLLNEHFAAHNTTVLAIAHRLRSIIGFDTVVVLDHGKVVEKGSPRELLMRDDGWFCRLATSTGEDELGALRKAAGL
ncbi:multidrug resistance-associated ABC transporter [Moesziomyces antarcticus]|uniref:Multidrug resistance-associated ABC transporter n=2 Tax=Pseudozyma antarctica TaxID=84753 RepID=A0A081CNH8_PSEA2|nr:multidrug resistance-associated ABC transporter [Moesziomyces antarcticus]GAK68224.1 multidrug resistance-associated ABC transporter [Moesziomyces antarcticus]